MTRKKGEKGEEDYIVKQLAPLLKDRHPYVKAVRIEYSYEDFNGHEPPEPGVKKFSPESQAYFKVKCPYRECVKGGHDLNEAISKVFKKRETEASGEVVCMGWQDRERIGSHNCRLKMVYKVKVTYID